MHLVGLDVGYAPRSATNAVAIYRDESLALYRLTVAERTDFLSHLTDVQMIAIDAPIIGEFAPPRIVRAVETAFVRGAFQKRCKPGMSHVRGTGEMLRQHGALSAASVREGAKISHATPIPRVVRDCNIVEAFPNAFLGVVLDDSCHKRVPRLKRGHKFDWLYDRWIDQDLFTAAAEKGRLDRSVVRACHNETNHEKRAALVCLLTAATVASGEFVAVGDADGGYFFMPPRSLWSSWAWTALYSNLERDDGDLVIIEKSASLG